jgi:plasmid stabilization system protein ParE
MDSLAAYIAADSPTAALRVLDRIEATVERLAVTPIGHPGRVAGTYEMPIRRLPYVVAYTLQTVPRGRERLVVLRVIHGARNWPEGEWPKN